MPGERGRRATATAEALRAVEGWPVRAAVGVRDAGGILATTGPTDEASGWASVTKLLTTLAILVAVEEGTVDLDAPGGPPGSTVRHLLAHASGLSRDSDRCQAPPATRRIYSNRGIELAAQALESAASMPFADYLEAAVLDPLDMGATTLVGSPASGARGPLRDLLHLAGELVSPTLVSVATLSAATTATFPHLDGVLPGFGSQRPNDWGIGFELRGHKSPHWTGVTNSPATFGHFGLSGAFLWVDPVAGLACAGVASEDFGPWAAEVWPALADSVIAADQ